ncbi:MAG: hypothetical protein BJ554DRAFT_7426 [Olpidium bornovanus]|uniref:Cytochrome c oxidase subunit 8, mitochondrial n=1 Tax=Olpidium bornovanus TaxID=278681 RepID=A0A8H7ZW59_9FUNG|nr:MAG: hypothetical protein BJ554DRAFT_7426 [Olpidium bornovanus]
MTPFRAGSLLRTAGWAAQLRRNSGPQKGCFPWLKIQHFQNRPGKQDHLPFDSSSKLFPLKFIFFFASAASIPILHCAWQLRKDGHWFLRDRSKYP